MTDNPALNPPAQLSPASQLLARAMDTASHWGRGRSFALTCGGLMVAIAVDWLSGARVSMMFFYLVVCAFAAWTLGEKIGFVFATVTMTVVGGMNYLEIGAAAGMHVPVATQVWNGVLRILSAALIVAVFSGLRCALALEKWRASTDSLTGALNKGAFMARMPAIVRAAAASERVLVLCYMDLDGFKQVNDGFGHSAGDRVLRSFAEGATKAIRSGDLFARIGGDEFVGLLSVRNIAEGDTVAEMVHARLTRVLGDMEMGVGCSMGALVFRAPQSGELNGALELADKLMYEVKRSGKDALRIGHPVIMEPVGPDTPERQRLRSRMQAGLKKVTPGLTERRVA